MRAASKEKGRAIASCCCLFFAWLCGCRVVGWLASRLLLAVVCVAGLVNEIRFSLGQSRNPASHAISVLETRQQQPKTSDDDEDRVSAFFAFAFVGLHLYARSSSFIHQSYYYYITMIQYNKSVFGLTLAFRVGGSAVYRAAVQGFASVLLLILMRLFWTGDGGDAAEQSVVDDNLLHPYTIAVVVVGIIFLMVFRLQQSYGRYWDAAAAVHQMQSKWMDGVMHAATYHMQSHRYDNIKPPSFHEYGDLDSHFMSRMRERIRGADVDGYGYADNNYREQNNKRIQGRATEKSIEGQNEGCGRVSRVLLGTSGGRSGSATSTAMPSLRQSHRRHPETDALGRPVPRPLEGPARLDGNWGELFPPGDKTTYFDPSNPFKIDDWGFAGYRGGRTPSLFLQELAHLSSLLCGVAFATLRNDADGYESPLDVFQPGAPWPAVDPDQDVVIPRTCGQKLLSFLGQARTPEERTKYNAARPLPVIGGVSGAEIHFLRTARGPYAKTQLAWFWLSEFITREMLAGSFGDIGQAMISRVMQFVSDGMVGYNTAYVLIFLALVSRCMETISTNTLFVTYPALLYSSPAGR